MYPYLDGTLDLEQRVDDLLARLAPEEKVGLCHGVSAMEIGDIPRLGIGRLKMGDGPQGFRLEDGNTATALPCGIALACTWNPGAAERFGRVIGREGQFHGIRVSLGPGFNLMRTPLCGRNFEYYGEDPVLAGRIACGYIRGCQGEGVAATPKHLAMNNQEICRTTGSSNADERTIRELYLVPFEIAVREARPWMMMSSYNKINGIYASTCKPVQEDIIKDEYGFDGVMVSDWGGAHDTRGCALGGLDLEMGQGMDSIMGKPLLELVRNGEIPESEIDKKVRRTLRLLFRTGMFDPDRAPAGACNTAEHRLEARRIAQEGMVLLKNDGPMLPLDIGKIRKIAVIGPNADFKHHMGALEVCGGSGAVHPPYEISPLEGLRNYCGGKVEILHVPGIVFDSETIIPPSLLGDGLKAEYFRSRGEMADGGVPFALRNDHNMSLAWSERFKVSGSNTDGLPTGGFAVRWTGTITPDFSGTCRLGVNCLHGAAKISLAGEDVIETGSSRFEAGFHEFRAESGRAYPVTVEFHATGKNPEFKLLWRADRRGGFDEALKAAAEADAVLFFGGTNHHYDKEAIGWGDVPGADIPDLELIGPQAELIGQLAEVNPNIAVILVNGSVVSTEKWHDRAAAILEAWYPGQESGNAIAEVLFGEAFPGGKLCCTWGKRLEDYACHANGSYPGVRGNDDPQVNYEEGLFIGYRYFDREGIEPRFPFGFGLSYTTFECELVSCRIPGDHQVAARVRVSNTGGRRGAEVVQLYVEDDETSYERPPRELKAFAKAVLDPGESAVVELSLNRRDFSFWNPDFRQWEVEPGSFTLCFGTSSRDIFARKSVG